MGLMIFVLVVLMMLLLSAVIFPLQKSVQVTERGKIQNRKYLYRELENKPEKPIKNTEIYEGDYEEMQYLCHAVFNCIMG